MIFLTFLAISKEVADSISKLNTGRYVSLRKVRVATNVSFGYHWGVQVDDYFWKPERFEVDRKGKISYAKWYAPVETASYKGKSKGGAGNAQMVGITTKTDDKIKEFSNQWLKQHPDYNLLTENCQTYAADLIKFLCGPDAENSLPWQEEQFKIPTSLLFIGIVTSVVLVYGAYWAVNKLDRIIKILIIEK